MMKEGFHECPKCEGVGEIRDRIYWKMKPYEDKPGQYILESDDGGCLGFRYYSYWDAVIIGFLENFLGDTWITKKYASWFMKRMGA